MLEPMRIDAKGMVGQYPTLFVRKTLRQLRDQFQWGLSTLEAAAGLLSGSGRALLKTLQDEGLVEPAGRDAWAVTQAGRTFSSATAAKPVTRATAEAALSEFLGRVKQRINRQVGSGVRATAHSSLRPRAAYGCSPCSFAACPSRLSNVQKPQ